MDRRSFLVGSAGIVGTLAFVGCGSNKKPGSSEAGTNAAAPRPILRLAGGDSGFPSPFAYMRGPGYIQASFIYDTLVWKDSTGKVIPWLATTYKESDDARSYTFTLRDRITWHDGQPLTADDVAFTFEYFRSQTISPQVIIQPFPEIAEVKATDPRTVVFNLSKPIAEFFGYGGVGSVPIVPKHIWSSINNAGQQSDPAVLVGSGPYRLESYSRGQGGYLYTAYDGFFLGKPFVQRLEYQPVGDALNGLQAGELDAGSTAGIRPEVLAPFRSNAAFEVLQAPSGNSTSALYWNITKGGALSDARFRRACARAIDRQDLAKRLFGDSGSIGNPGWVPSANPYHVDVEQYPFDRSAAESMLDEAGYKRSGGQDVRQAPDGKPLRFSLLVTNPVPPYVDVVVRSLRAIGVELTPQALDTPTFNQRVIAGNSEMSIIGSGGMNTDHGEGGYFYQVYYSKTKTTQHAQGYANPKVDQLIEQQEFIPPANESERKKIVAEIQRMVAADLPILPLFYSDIFEIFRKSTFDQWYYTPGGVAGTVPTVENKQVFVTGRKTGTAIRPMK